MDELIKLHQRSMVRNSEEVYREVAAYDLVPPEKLYHYWHTYTILQRRLASPVAYRLEHFWWHVWGSDRRRLSGKTLVRIFEHISKGPTIVPMDESFSPEPAAALGGPSSGGPTVGSRSNGVASRKGKEVQRPPVQRREREAGKREDGDRGGESSASQRSPIKREPSSSTKPPPLHPILKKPRGPSNSGPRPTPRFITPSSDSSEDDDGRAGLEEPEKVAPPPRQKNRQPSSGDETTQKPKNQQAQRGASSAAVKEQTVEVRSSSTGSTGVTSPTKRKAPALGKRFVATTTASKRRPALPRRSSSQTTPAGSQAGSRENGSGTTISSAARSQRGSLGGTTAVSSGSESTAKGSTPLSNESSASSSQKARAALSARSAGKKAAGRTLEGSQQGSNSSSSSGPQIKQTQRRTLLSTADKDAKNGTAAAPPRQQPPPPPPGPGAQAGVQRIGGQMLPPPPPPSNARDPRLQRQPLPTVSATRRPPLSTGAGAAPMRRSTTQDLASLRGIRPPPTSHPSTGLPPPPPPSSAMSGGQAAPPMLRSHSNVEWGRHRSSLSQTHLPTHLNQQHNLGSSTLPHPHHQRTGLPPSSTLGGGGGSQSYSHSQTLHGWHPRHRGSFASTASSGSGGSGSTSLLSASYQAQLLPVSPLTSAGTVSLSTESARGLIVDFDKADPHALDSARGIAAANAAVAAAEDAGITGRIDVSMVSSNGVAGGVGDAGIVTGGVTAGEPLRRTMSSLDVTMSPTTPSPSAEILLGRTKSQLMLLLEREGSRNGSSGVWRK